MGSAVHTYRFLLILIINIQCCEMLDQSLWALSTPGDRYVPMNISAQPITVVVAGSWKSCADACHWNSLCQVFDHGTLGSDQCILFQGDIGMTGYLIPSGVPDSLVGSIQLSPSLFTEYGQSCLSTCAESRYLICSDDLSCRCAPYTYWNPMTHMCLPQMTFEGAPCDPSMKMCREDLGFQCLPTNQCGGGGGSVDESTPPPVIVMSNIIADSSTVIEGSTVVGLEYPAGIQIFDTADGTSLLVADSFRNEVILIENIHSDNKTASVLARNWTTGDALNTPTFLFLDINNHNELYLTDTGNNRVLLFTSMQITSPPPEQVAGDIGTDGDPSDRLTAPYGVAVDSEQNVYVADCMHHRIMLWKQNDTSGIMIAGTGSEGNGSLELNGPMGLFLDDFNSHLYVADRDNHRIQRFDLTGNHPYAGTTVAGGNGAGSQSNQLWQPADVWVSGKTGAIYIADSSNQRIQRWLPGRVQGTTIRNSPDVVTPTALTVNRNETRLYVSNVGTFRIQWYDLL